MLTASKVIVYQKKKKTRWKVAVAQTIIRSICMIFSDGYVLKRAAQTLWKSADKLAGSSKYYTAYI